MKEVTILVTCCLGDYMKGTIQCYKNNPDNRVIRVIGCDMNDMVYNFVGVDKFYKVGRCDSQGYVDQLMAICIKENVDVLIPFNTNELELVSWYVEDFARIGTKVLVSDSWALDISNDKVRFYENFRRENINTPMSLVTSDYKVLKRFLKENAGRTFCVKQRHGCGSRGFRIIGKNSGLLTDKPSGVYIQDEELQELFDKSDNYLVQEYLPGDEYTVDMVVDHGKVLYSACKLNANMENGVARRSVVVENDMCINQCAYVCNVLKLHGNIGFDLKCSEDGVPYIIDVNPRMTATVSLIAKAGINMPYIALQLALGEPVRDDYKLKYGTSIVRKITDYYFDESGELLE